MERLYTILSSIDMGVAIVVEIHLWGLDGQDTCIIVARALSKAWVGKADV